MSQVGVVSGPVNQASKTGEEAGRSRTAQPIVIQAPIDAPKRRGPQGPELYDKLHANAGVVEFWQSGPGCDASSRR